MGLGVREFGKISDKEDEILFSLKVDLFHLKFQLKRARQGAGPVQEVQPRLQARHWYSTE